MPKTKENFFDQMDTEYSLLTMKDILFFLSQSFTALGETRDPVDGKSLRGAGYLLHFLSIIIEGQYERFCNK